MSSWILFATLAYLSNAVNAVVDKFLLNSTVRHPVVYAFYSGVLSLSIIVLAPFGLKFLSPLGYFLAFVSGGAFAFALYFLYTAIQATSVSRVLPIQGGFIPVFTLLLAYFVLGERLMGSQYLAFGLLVVGAVIISIRREEAGKMLRPQALGSALLAAVFFALSFVLLKYTYNHTNFISGLVWTRIGLGLTALSFLIPKINRERIFRTGKSASTGSKRLFYASRITGALGGLAENYAISIGSVSLVKALQGTQYAFLLLLTSFLTIYFPKILKERLSVAILLQKLSAIALITVGLILLAE